jgi:hypothetical protein
MNQEIFFFDYHRFLSENEVLMSQADAGNILPMVQQAHHLTQILSPEDWILDELGCHLSQLDRFEKWPAAQAGFALLVVLSSYLERTDSRYFSYKAIAWLRMVCKQLGWTDENVERFRKGNKVESLFKPGVEFPKEQMNQESVWLDPKNYWLGARPERSLNNGWFSLEDIRFYSQLLVENQYVYQQIDINALDIAASRKPHHPPLPTREQALKMLSDVLHLFDKALTKGVGLYWVTAL